MFRGRRNGKLLCIGIFIILLTIILAGCGNSKENARKELAKMNVEYTVNSFLKAIENNDDVVCKLFIDAGMDLGGQDDNGETPLMAASKIGNIDLIKQILKDKSDTINTVDNKEKSALFYAVSSSHQDVVELLTDANVDWKTVDVAGENILHCAVLGSSKDLVSMALDHGIDINAKTAEGKTPLLLAIEKQNVDIIRLLLENKADISITNREGKLPIEIAKDENNSDIIKILEEYGAKIPKQKYDVIYETYKVTAPKAHVEVSAQDIYLHIGQKLVFSLDESSVDPGAVRWMTSMKDMEVVSAEAIDVSPTGKTSKGMMYTGKNVGIHHLQIVPNYGDFDRAAHVNIIVVDK